MARIKGRPNPPTTGNHWGATVAARRVAMGYTQEAFADLLAVKVKTLQAWESGRRTSLYSDIFDGIITRLEKKHEQRLTRKQRREAA